jgi:ABC-type Fe3+-siderophore transport system permease subunit
VISLLIYFVVMIIVLSFAYWVVGQLLPPPIQKFAYIVLALIGVIFVVWLLLGMAHGPPYLPGWR